MKARARALRWKEELELIPEEIRRYIVTMEYECDEWHSRAHNRTDVSPELQEGLAAYAARQAAMYRGLGLRAKVLWSDTLAKLKEDPGVKGKEPAGITAAGTATEGIGDDDDDDDDDEDNAGVEEIEEKDHVVDYLEIDVDDYIV